MLTIYIFMVTYFMFKLKERDENKTRELSEVIKSLHKEMENEPRSNLYRSLIR